MTDQVDYGVREDTTMPIVCYALYLAAFITGITAVIGVVLAYMQQGTAGPIMRTHYTFLIRPFWIGLVAAIATAVLFGVGALLSIILIGIPILIVAGLICALLTVWYAVRCIAGLVYLSRGEPYPRPYAVLA